MLENKETGERTEKYSVLSASRQNIAPYCELWYF